MKYNIYIQKMIDLNLIPKRGIALDISPGSGRDTRALKDLGLEVVAGSTNSSVESFLFEKEKYDVIIASNILSFISNKSKIKQIIWNMNEALKPGGVMYLSLFGIRDDWANRDNMSFFDDEEIKNVLPDNISIIEKSVTEGLSKSFLGKIKYSHVYVFICKK